MANSLQITLAPQLVLTITHDMGGVAAGFTIIAGISRSTGGGAGNEYLNAEKVKLAGIETAATADQTGAEIKALYEVEANAFTDAQFTKLAGVETAATADQTNAEIRTAVEAATNSNVFNDADHSKLNAIEANATGDQSNAEIRTAVEAASDSNVFTDADHSKLNAIESGATADQTGAQIKALYEQEANAFTNTKNTKLAGIETSATADQTNAEIRTAVEAATNSNVFTDADHSKLDAMDADASDDQTGAEIKALYEQETNAFTDAQFTKLAGIEDDATADQSNSEIETAYNAQVDQIDAAEISAGTEGTVRRLAPDDVVAMIDEHAPAAIASAHYQDPVADIAELTALPESGLVDAERRFVELQVADYFYDIDAVSGDEQPDDQTGGTGFWITVADTGGGSSPAQIKSKYEKNANTNAFEDAEKTKLATVETDATADQTNAEIRTAVGAATDSNVFQDADASKLDGIEATADITDAGNVAAAGAVMDGDFTAGEGFLRKTGSGAYVAMKSNLGATTNPIVTSDTAAGYVVGSRWINTTLDTEYVCLDATNGAAVWTETTGAGGGMSDEEVKTAYENNDDTNAFDDAVFEHYRDPLSGIAELIALTEASLFDRERRYVVTTRSDYYYDSTAVDGDYAPTDQTGGNGFWFKANITSDANIKIAYENNGDTNAFDDDAVSKLAGIAAGAEVNVTDTDYYDLGMDFLGVPTDAQVIARWIVLREITIPADFSGAGGDINTNPTGALAINIKDDGTIIGTISISTSGVFTFTTVSGTEKVVAAGSIVTAHGPDTADATGEDIVFTLPGVL